MTQPAGDGDAIFEDRDSACTFAVTQLHDHLCCVLIRSAKREFPADHVPFFWTILVISDRSSAVNTPVFWSIRKAVSRCCLA